jgi:hypothetical protein
VWCQCSAAAQVNNVNEDKLGFLGTNYETETTFWRVQLLDYGLDSLEFHSWWGQKRFFLPNCPDRLRDPLIVFFSGCGVLYPGLKRPDRSANHSSRYKAEVMNEYNRTPSP